MPRSQRYLEHFLRRLRELARKRGVLTAADVDRVIKSERARTGGEVRAERARSASGVAADDYGQMGMPIMALPVADPDDDDDDDPDLDDIADVFGLLEIEGSYQDSIEDVCEALKATYGDELVVVATFPDRVIYGACDVAEDGEFTLYSQQYSTDAQGTVHLAARNEVGLEADSFKPQPAEPALADDPAPPKNLSPQQQQHWQKFYRATLRRCKADPETCKKQAASAATKMAGNVQASDARRGTGVSLAGGGDPSALISYFNSGADGQISWGDAGDFNQCLALASKHMDPDMAKGFCANRHMDATGMTTSQHAHAEGLSDRITPFPLRLADTTNKPWDGSAARFSDTAAYCAASIVNENTGPRSDWTQDKCHLPYKEPDGTVNLNALRAAASAVAGGRGSSPPAWASKAKPKLEALLKRYKIGEYADSGTKADDRQPVALADPAPYFTMAAVRLSDGAGGVLPDWQQVHKLGEWSEPHASGTRIQLTRDMGNTMIRNFHGGVIRRRVPLDEMHLTDQGGRALGWMTDLRWGSPMQGLPGLPEPDGGGPVLYGRFRYNALGQQMLADEQYAYLSPQYHLSYLDKESGREYGPAIVAVAATNNPFLRQRSIQGEEAPPVAVLQDGLIRPQEGFMAGANGTNGTQPSNGTTPQPQQGAVELTDRVVQLEEALRNERRARHEERVHALFDREVNAVEALEPRFRRLIEPVMLSADPSHEGIIRLADAAADAPPLNIYQVMEQLVAELPRLRTGRVTLADDTRPGEGTTQAKTVDDYLAEGKARAKSLGLSNGAGVPSIPAEA